MPRAKKKAPASKIIYGFVKHFAYRSQMTNYQMGGHPMNGRVYRILKDSDNAYRLHIGTENTHYNQQGLVLNSLIGSWPNWECEIEEITSDNMASLPITDEDFEKINKWDETKNSDLDAIIDPKTVALNAIPQGRREAVVDDVYEIDQPISQVIDRPEDIQEGMTISVSDAAIHFATIADRIKDSDPDMFKALVQLLLYLLQCYGDKYEAVKLPNLAKGITQDPLLGKGANVFTVTKYIQRYATSDFKKSANPEDLLKAVHYILFEIMRLKPWNYNEQN